MCETCFKFIEDDNRRMKAEAAAQERLSDLGRGFRPVPPGAKHEATVPIHKSLAERQHEHEIAMQRADLALKAYGRRSEGVWTPTGVMTLDELRAVLLPALGLPVEPQTLNVSVETTVTVSDSSQA